MKTSCLTFTMRVCGALLLAVASAFAAGGTMKGAGTAASPFQIEDYEDLKAIGTGNYLYSSSYVLTADIDASSSDFEPIGTVKDADGDTIFSGNFDGKNFTISNLTIDKPDEVAVGLFGLVDSASIKNLTLKNAKVTGNEYVGALAGIVEESNIERVVSVNGDVSGLYYVGGLVGLFGKDDYNTTKIKMIASTGNVLGINIVGGVIGYLKACVENVFSVSVVKGKNSVGGIIGSYSYSRCEIGDDGYRIPQLFHAYSASIEKSPDASGISGNHSYKYMWDVYFDSTITLGIHEEEKGRSTAEMLKKSTYEEFDFDSVWTIQEGKSYPYFIGMEAVLPGKLVDDGIINKLWGDGTEEHPYEISSYEELKYVGKYEYATNLYYKVTEDIDASASAKENCNSFGKKCKGFEPIGKFSGVFAGGRNKIRNLVINRPDEDSVGLFRALDSTAKVSVVLLQSAYVRGRNFVGGIAGVDLGTTLDSVYVRGDIYGGSYVGSIVGYKTSGRLNKYASRGTVTGEKVVGGLVGYLGAAELLNCYSIGFVQGEKYVGGLVGYSDKSDVDVSYAAGRVDAESDWGGIVGGMSDTMLFANVYYDSSLWHLDSTAGEGARSTKEMVQRDTYRWNFSTIWSMVQDSTYPYLQWIWWDRVAPGVSTDTSLLRMAGSGVEDDPFLIKTYADLKSIGKGKYKLSAVYRLVNDIDASASKTENANHPYFRGFEPIGNLLLDSLAGQYCSYGDRDSSGQFTGKIYGDGHVIKNLYMEALSGDSTRGKVAFISQIGPEGVIDNLSLTATANGDDIAGIAVVNNGTIAKSKVDFVVKHGTESDGAVVGGIVVYNNVDAIISDCRATVNIDADSIAGGIAAVNKGNISNSIVSGTITSKTLNAAGIGGAVGVNESRGHVESVGSFVNLSGYKNVGGFVGVNIGFGEIIYSFSSGEVKGTSDYSLSNGGFVSQNDGSIRRSFSTGDVYNGVAFAAENSRVVEDCYSTSNVYASKKWKGAAAFVNMKTQKKVTGYATGTAYLDDGTSYCVQQISRGSDDKGFYFINENCNNIIGTGLTKEAMRKQESFTEFDFDSVWTIKEGKSYPILRNMTNTPIAGNVVFDLENNKSLTKTVQNGINDAVIDMGAGSDIIIKLSPASESLLDSLAKAKSVSGKFELVYRVGVKVGDETIWGNNGHVDLMIDYHPVRIENSREYGKSFGISLHGTHVAVRYEIPVPGSVKFVLLDMQGRVVKHVYFGNRAAGAYFETVSTETVSHGGYIGVLQVNGKIVEKSELFIK